MSTFPRTPNDIDAFADMIRSALPEVIAAATERSIEQLEDRELVASAAAREAAFEIDLSNGSRYQVTLRQTRDAGNVCTACDEVYDEDELDDEGVCPGCAEPPWDPPCEAPYDFGWSR